MRTDRLRPRSRPASGLALVLMGIGLVSGLRGSVRADDRPTDRLLKLTPPDAAATLVVEGLRDRLREFIQTPMAEGLARLPTVDRWRRSESGRQLEQARVQIEAILGVAPETIRDELLGDAIVLALVENRGVGEPSGLLLTRVRDPKLLTKLVRVVNLGERSDGTLREVVDREHAGLAYHVRRFEPGTKPDESYATLDGDLFAWSNSEAVIRGVLERRAGRGSGLFEVPKFHEVRRALPSESAACLFLDPAALGDSFAEESDPFALLLRHHLNSLEYVGLALELRDGVVLHAHESFASAPEVGPEASESTRSGASLPTDLLSGLPAGVLGFAAGSLDFSKLFEAFYDVLGPEDRTQADRAVAVATGFLMGRNFRTEVLPRLGPGVVAYLLKSDPPPAPAPNHEGRETERGVALVMAVELNGDDGLAEAIENGLKTLTALIELDAKGNSARVLSTLLRYRVEPGLLVLGTSKRAVAEFAGRSDPRTPTGLPAEFRPIRDQRFPDAQAYGYLDLRALVELAESRSEMLAERLGKRTGDDPAETARDLEELLAIARLFRVGYYARTVPPDLRSVHYTLGLIARGREVVR